ncbi:aconitase X swivel domain-containing protein [Thermodesulfobacteriota bacterium]
MSNVKAFKAKKISAGKASGPALVTRERISFSGFADLEKGIFTEGTLAGTMGGIGGASFAGAVLIFPCSKGSTTWTIKFDVTCRFGNAPSAIINSKVDPFVVLGCVMQDIPLVMVEDLTIFEQVKNGDTVMVDADTGEITVG